MSRFQKMKAEKSILRDSDEWDFIGGRILHQERIFRYMKCEEKRLLIFVYFVYFWRKQAE